jgi:hypothetical protein
LSYSSPFQAMGFSLVRNQVVHCKSLSRNPEVESKIHTTKGEYFTH